MKIFKNVLLISLVVIIQSLLANGVFAGECLSCKCGCATGHTFSDGSVCCFTCKDSSLCGGSEDPCFNVKCEKGEPTVEGDKCICSKDPYNLPEEDTCLWNECGKKDGKTKCCLQGYYCGGTLTHDYICVRIGGATGGDSNDCDVPNKTCGTTACTYCQEAGFTCTNTGYSLGGIAECSGRTNCANVTLKYSCYEQVPNPDNTRTVSISMGTNNISGSKVWTATQERTNFSSVNVDTETQALIQSWIPSNKTIAISAEEYEEETIINSISWLKNIVEKAFAAEPTYTTTTSQGYTNDNASGLELNNPTKVVASFTDTSGVNDLEGLFYWLTSEGTNVVKSPRYIDDSASLSTAKTVSAEDFGFMIRRGSDIDQTDEWTDTSGLYVYVPAITTAGNYWIKAGSFGSDFYIYGPNGLKMVRIFNMVMSIPSSTTITLTFNIEFLNENSGISSYEKVTDGTYDVLEMAIDEYSFLTWNKYTIPTTQTTDGVGINPDTVRTYFSEHSIRDYREWTDTGLNWVVDLTKPNISQMIISTETYEVEGEGIKTDLKINWDAADTGSGIAYLVENLFTEYFGETENSYIDFTSEIKYSGTTVPTENTNFLIPSFLESLIGKVSSGKSILEKDWRSDAKGVQTYYGITHGLKFSSLNFVEDQFNGASNRNEIDIICGGDDNDCYILTVEGKVIYTPAIRGGVAISDDATGDGFIMYSPVKLSTRGIYSQNTANSYNYIAVRYEEDEGGWQYNDDKGWVNFSPIAGDILVADVNFDGSEDYGVLAERYEQDIDVLGADTIDISNSSGNLLTAYLTVFDEAGNFDTLSDSYNTDSWLITRGGLLFSEEGTNIAIPTLTLTSREYQGVTKGLQTSDLSFSVRADETGVEMACVGDYCSMTGLDGQYVKFNNGTTTYDINDVSVSETTLVRSGVRMKLTESGTIYILYSVTDLYAGTTPRAVKASTVTADISKHFIIVRYNESLPGWQYNDGKIWKTFSIQSSDILVATILYQRDEPRSGYNSLGISRIESVGDSTLFTGRDDPVFGLQTSNLIFKLGWYGDLINDCEIQIVCMGGDSNCSLTTTSGVTYTSADFSLGKGMTLTGENPVYCSGASGDTYAEYIMFSTQKLHCASTENCRHFDMYTSSSDNFYIAHYYYSTKKWTYNNNNEWITFTPLRGIDYIIGQTKTYGLSSVWKFERVTGNSWPGTLWLSPSADNLSSVFDSSTADISTEILAGNVKNAEDLYKLIHSTPITTDGAYNESSLVLENIGIIKNSAYITYRARAKAQESINSAYEYVPSTDTTFSGSASNYCKDATNTVSKYCVVDSQYNITIASGFSCDTKILFMTSGNIDIEPSVKNANGTSACIFLAGGDITIGEGTYASSGQTEPKYDYVEGFLIADGIINIKSGDAGKSVKDGLQVNGGMVGFGGSAKSIVITRDMKLADKQLYPIVAVMADSRYGKTALTFFGAEFTVYKQEVGYKPY